MQLENSRGQWQWLKNWEVRVEDLSVRQNTLEDVFHRTYRNRVEGVEMKFISIAIKDFKEIVRDRRGLFFIILFPIFLMMIFGFALEGWGRLTLLTIWWL